MLAKMRFLVAYTGLYKSLSRSVRPSVGWSVRHAVEITAPAHLYATDVVYTALFNPWRQSIGVKPLGLVFI